jgi:hypothetical protein
MILLGYGRPKDGQYLIAHYGLERPTVPLHRGLRQGIETR